jgi:hypothetical protein
MKEARRGRIRKAGTQEKMMQTKVPRRASDESGSQEVMKGGGDESGKQELRKR